MTFRAGQPKATAYKIYCPINTLSRKLSFNTTRMRFFLTLISVGSRLNRFIATCRITPRLCGALPRQRR